MNTDELSTGGGSPSAKSKKREGEKRTSPLTPLREKGKGKEQDRVSCETSCSKTARARVAKASVRVFFFRGGRGGGLVAPLGARSPGPWGRPGWDMMPEAD